jgi:hypothetical protein
MLVLAIIVITTAFAWPALERPMADLRLRKAADVVRTEWARTRVKAMSKGETYLFYCAAASGQYRIQCQAGAEPVAAELLGGLAGSQTLSNTVPTTAAAEEKTLPEGITFYAENLGLSVMDPAALGPMDSSLDSAVWSEPVMFYPDGTTSDAQLQLKNENDRVIELSLRGLTGTVSVGDVTSVGEATW